jgi:hypothetical membrane protein
MAVVGRGVMEVLVSAVVVRIMVVRILVAGILLSLVGISHERPEPL